MKQLLLIGCILILLNDTFSQVGEDTVFHIGAVEIQAVSLRKQKGVGEEIRFDSLQLSAYQHHSLADLLQRESNVFIKSYGLGSLASISMRGAGASHTAILWNGLPIENPMLGQIDLALLPIAGIDRLSLQLGGNSAAWGSGAIGGSLSLENTPTIQTGLAISTNHLLGAFGRQSHASGISFRNKKWTVESQWYQQKAENDFIYELANGEERQNTHADFTNWGLLQEIYFRPSKKQEWSARVWYQQTDRNIPPTTTQNQSLAAQADEALRATLSWKAQLSSHLLKVQTGFTDEEIIYTDEAIRLRAESEVQRWVNEITLSSLTDSPWNYEVGYQYQLASALADGYGGSEERHQHAYYASGRYQSGGWLLNGGLRQEIVDGIAYPITPKIAASYELIPQVNIWVSLSRNIRIPTLNELYWRPGGNLDLEAERSWNQEVGSKYQTELEDVSLAYQLTYYQRQTQNWILWALQESQPFWSASNLSEVHTRGISQRITTIKNIGRWKASLSGGYEWVRSLHTTSLSSPEIAADKQLFYVPEHKAHLSLALSNTSFRIEYTHVYTSEVETFSTPLPAWDVGSVLLSYQWKQLEGFFRIENLWDTQYRIIERRPMPGRYVEGGISFTWKTPKPKQTI
ncbi:MAG: TonB-dependent receptor [Bacteroidota bacterium]